MRDKKHLVDHSNKLAENAKEKALFRTQRKPVEAGAHGTLNYTIKKGINKNKIAIFKNNKFLTKNTHGTGCTLSSAIATFFGCGKTLKKSCEMGIKYVNQAIKTGPNFGKGHGPINHLNSIIINRKFR